jgi:diguanylate cyclase (GGDEF)-like protein
MVLMPDTDEPGARVAAAKLHAAVRRVRVPGIDEPITASFGVAAARGTAELDELVSTADAALYRAKEDGRDRVTAASDAPRTPLAVA